MTANKHLRTCLDHCLYLSLVTTSINFIDLKFERRADLINLIAALSVLAQKLNPRFSALTDRAVISNNLVRILVTQIAKKHHVSIKQLFTAAIFNTLLQVCHRDKSHVNIKNLQGIRTLLSLCVKIQVDFSKL